VDNACRMYQGFTPTGSEPGIGAVFSAVQNCAIHPLLMVPANVILGDHMAISAIKHDVA